MSLFTAVAFTAAFIEGTSVINHAQKKRQSDSEESPPTGRTVHTENVIGPAIVYSVMSLPLSVIGASPSLPLVSKIINVSPDLNEDEGGMKKFANDGMTTFVPNPSEATAKPRRRMKLGSNTNISKHGEYGQEDVHDELYQSQRKRFEVKRVREENRQALAAIRERREKDKLHHRRSDFIVNKIIKDSYATHPSTKYSATFRRSLSTYIATLDGQALPTSLAELMRRVRLLAFGCGIMSATIAYQMKSSDKPKEPETDDPIYSPGRNPIMVQHFLKNLNIGNSIQSSEEGVAMRLFHDINELKKYSQNARYSTSPSSMQSNNSSNSRSVLPILTSTSDECMEGEMLCWSLGQTESEWKELPITTRWLFGHQKDTESKNRHPFILLESNLCTSLKDCLEEFSLSQRKTIQHRRKEEEQFQTVLLEAKKIQQVTLTKLFPKSTQLGAINVFIGNDKGRRNAFNMSGHEHIYINGLDVVANSIKEQIQIIRGNENDSPPIPIQKTNDTFSPTPGEEEEEEIIERTKEQPIPMRMVDKLGKHIRQHGQYLANQIGKSVTTFRSRRQSKKMTTIHVFSDDPKIIEWIEFVFRSNDDIRLHLYCNPTSSIENELSNPVAENDIFLFLCSSDAATINAASTVMQKNNELNKSQFLTILETVSSKETLTALTNSFFSNDNTPNSALCVTSMHEDIFSLVRKYLAAGKSASETQEAINRRML